jgi:predicted metalloprotease with PDZ domain
MTPPKQLRTARLGVCLLAVALLPAAVAAQAPTDKGTYLGALFGPRTTASPRSGAGGVLITHVLPGSPAATAGLRRQDVLLRYDRVPVRDCEHLANLIRDDRPDRKVALLVLRDHRELAVEATLTLGPALKLAPAGSDPVEPPLPTATQPAAVSVWASPLEHGKLKLTIDFYVDGRRQTVTCQGGAADIASTVQKLPERERDLVRIALARLRTINAPPKRP